MLTVPVAAWIGNAAAVVSGAGGASTQRAQHRGSPPRPCQGESRKPVNRVTGCEFGSVPVMGTSQFSQPDTSQNKDFYASKKGMYPL